MSNTLAIAAVTATLQKLIEDAIQADDGSSKVTTRSPDKLGDETNQLNLFLYHAEISAAWRNQNELPGQLKRGESGNPPLPLDLYYLLTAYGKSTPLGEEDGHKLLGRAMSVLHDHALLGADEIRNALPGNDLHQQIERVRITAQPLGIDEMNKLWGAFQTNYRLSVAYRVSLVLIESQRSKRAPLPVLTIGAGDSGIISQPSLIPPYPTLESIILPANQTSARLGDPITLVGHHLSGSAVEVRLVHPVLSSPIVIPSAAFIVAGNKAITFPIPNTGSAPRDFPAGFYSVSVAVTDGGETRLTNELALPLAPRIESRSPASAPAGNFTVTVTCKPQVRPAQRLRLLFGGSGSEIAPEPFALPGSTSAASTLIFNIQNASPGQQFLRLRVDGVDSILIQAVGVPPVLQFDPAQMVTVT